MYQTSRQFQGCHLLDYNKKTPQTLKNVVLFRQAHRKGNYSWRTPGADKLKSKESVRENKDKTFPDKLHQGQVNSSPFQHQLTPPVVAKGT